MDRLEILYIVIKNLLCVYCNDMKKESVICKIDKN